MRCKSRSRQKHSKICSLIPPFVVDPSQLSDLLALDVLDQEVLLLILAAEPESEKGEPFSLDDVSEVECPVLFRFDKVTKFVLSGAPEPHVVFEPRVALFIFSAASQNGQQQIKPNQIKALEKAMLLLP